MITVVSVTGVNKEAHQQAIDRTRCALPRPSKGLLLWFDGMDYYEYNRFVLQSLWAYINTPFALIVQADGYGVNPENWNDEFMAFDYVGACWSYPPYVGNGGFCLRSKKLLELTRHLPAPELNEDFWICVNHREFLESCGVRFAPPEIAARFSYEHQCDVVEGHGPHMAFGAHGSIAKSLR